MPGCTRDAGARLPGRATAADRAARPLPRRARPSGSREGSARAAARTSAPAAVARRAGRVVPPPPHAAGSTATIAATTRSATRDVAGSFTSSTISCVAASGSSPAPAERSPAPGRSRSSTRSSSRPAERGRNRATALLTGSRAAGARVADARATVRVGSVRGIRPYQSSPRSQSFPARRPWTSRRRSRGQRVSARRRRKAEGRFRCRRRRRSRRRTRCTLRRSAPRACTRWNSPRPCACTSPRRR